MTKVEAARINGNVRRALVRRLSEGQDLVEAVSVMVLIAFVEGKKHNKGDI